MRRHTRVRVAFAMAEVGAGTLLVGGCSANAHTGGVFSQTRQTRLSSRQAASILQQRFRKFLDDREKKKTASHEVTRREPRPLLLDSDDSSDEDEVSTRHTSVTTSQRDTVATSQSVTLKESSPSNAKLIKCALLTIAWFGLSTSLALYNKTLFGQRKGGFPAPLLLTSVQFLMQYLLANGLLIWVVPHLQPKRVINWRTFTYRVAPVGFAMGLDIGLSNLSLVYVTVSFYTLAKTSSIVFLIAFAFGMRVEPVSARLVVCVFILCLGEVLVVRGETQFNALGAFLCFFAAAASGVRWVLSQKVLHSGVKDTRWNRTGTSQTTGSGFKDTHGNRTGTSGTTGSDTYHPTSNNRLRKSHGMHHPIVMLRVMMPVMSVVVFVFSLFQEKWWATLPGSDWLATPGDLFVDLLITAFGALMALTMSMAEFQLVKETSAMTVSVIGAGKDVVTVLVAVLVMGDGFGWENVVGMALVLAGILCYNWHKAVSAREVRDADALLVDMKVQLAEFAKNNVGDVNQGGDGNREDAVAAATAARNRLAAELGIGAPATAHGAYHKVPKVSTRRDAHASPQLPRTGYARKSGW